MQWLQWLIWLSSFWLCRKPVRLANGIIDILPALAIGYGGWLRMT